MDRFQAAIAVAVLLVAGAAFYVWWQLKPIDEDRGHQRAASEAALRRYAKVIEAYRGAHEGSWPANTRALDRYSRSLADETLHLGWAARAVIGAGTYKYHQPEATAAGDVIVMASVKEHVAIAVGEIANGKPAAAAIPAIQIVLLADLRIATITDAEQRQRAAWLYVEK